MKKFKFTFQVLLDGAIEKEQECAVRLKEVLDVLSRVEKQRDELLAEKLENVNRLSDNKAIDIMTFKEIKLYIDEINDKIVEKNKEIAKVEELEEKRLEELKLAKVNTSTYEKLKSKQHANYIEDIRKQEEKLLEEQIMNKYNRKKEVN